MAFIDLENVSRWYGEFQALRNVELHLEPGRIGLLGPNGAGKSSLLKILMGLLPVSSGAGRVLGHELFRENTTGFTRRLKHFAQELFAINSGLRRSIGYMPEADALIPGMHGAEYVALAGASCTACPGVRLNGAAHEVLTYLGMEEARYRRLEEYSTGMKQRIKLAQALVHDPPVLLLDEPTSGLDPAGREAMLALLTTLGRDHGKSIILSTHLLGDVERVCERVIILHQGNILLQGLVRELCLRRQDRYRLQLQGKIDAFLAELRLEGANVLEDNERGDVRVEVPPGWVTRAFFALADNHGVLLRGLQRDDENLEDLFHRVLAESERNGR